MYFYSYTKGGKIYSLKGKDWKEIKEHIKWIDDHYDATIAHVVTRHGERREIEGLEQWETFVRAANEEVE